MIEHDFKRVRADGPEPLEHRLLRLPCRGGVERALPPGRRVQPRDGDALPAA